MGRPVVLWQRSGVLLRRVAYKETEASSGPRLEPAAAQGPYRIRTVSCAVQRTVPPAGRHAQPAQPHHPGGNQHSRGHNIRGVKDGPAGRTGAGLLKPAAQPAVQAQLTDTHGEQADQRHRLGPSRNMPVPNWPRRSALLRTRRLPSRGTWAAGLRHRLPASRHSRSSGRAGCDQENTGRQREGAQESAAIKVHPAPSLSAV
jgi:hypothetical protein